MRVIESGRTCGDRLRVLIKQKCGTVRRFARKVDLTESAVSHMLHGRRKLYSWNVERFSKVLGVDLDDYLEGEDEGIGTEQANQRR